MCRRAVMLIFLIVCLFEYAITPPFGVAQLFTVGKDGALFVWNWVPYADGEGPQIEAEGIVLWLM
jgi:hypothetical protein